MFPFVYFLYPFADYNANMQLSFCSEGKFELDAALKEELKMIIKRQGQLI